MPMPDISVDQIIRHKIHHGKNRFINPFEPQAYVKPTSILKWKLFSKNHFKPLYQKERITPIHLDKHAFHTRDNLSITFINHGCVLINDKGTKILIDPVFFGISSWIKNFTPLAFNPLDLPKPNHILITHGHYDHLDRKTIACFANGTNITTPLGYSKLLKEIGVRQHNQLDWFDTLSDGWLKITLLPCHHWTMRNPLIGPNRDLWGAYLIQTTSGPTIFCSGDTAYFNGFKEIGERYAIDLAIFNLGAYEPRWLMADSHMNPAETVKAFCDLGARHLMITHWGTFRLGDEPVYLPPLELKNELEKQGISDRLLSIEHGQTLFYRQNYAKFLSSSGQSHVVEDTGLVIIT